MPDLFLWREAGAGGAHEGKFVEVKGPRDSLSDQQVAWLRELQGSGAAVEVIKVVEPKA